MKSNARKKKPITANQCRKIHALKNALALSDDEYRAMLHGLYGVVSSTELSLKAAGHFIEELEGIAVNSGVWRRKEQKKGRYDELSGTRPGMATPAQLRKIESQWAEVSRADPDERRKALRHFLERIAKISDLRFLCRDGATKVINALSAMQKQQAGTGTGYER